MKKLDLEFVRRQFPAFSEESLEETSFFENAGGSYMCAPVSERLSDYYRECKVQPYYPNRVSVKAGNQMDEAYPAMARWLNVRTDQVYFGPSTSQNTYVLAQSMLGWLKPGDEIIVTNQDHEANIGSWRRLEGSGLVIREWQVDPLTGALDPESLKKLINDKTRLVTFPHCSNILGEINPVTDICRYLRGKGVRSVVDGVSFAGHGLPDVPKLECDIYLFSLYKVYGPHLGVMVISDEMAPDLSNQSHFFNDASREKRLMPSGPDHAQIASVKGVSDYFEAVYQHHFPTRSSSPEEKAETLRNLFHSAELTTLAPLIRYIEGNEKLKLIGPSDPDKRAPTVSVVPLNHSPIELAKALGEMGILCGAGHFYSVRLLQALGINPDEGVLRFSLVHYTSPQEVDKLISALESLI